MRKFGLVETRELSGYEFKMFDEYGGYWVEVWKDGEIVTEGYASCEDRINCIPTDEDLLALL